MNSSKKESGFYEFINYLPMIIFAFFGTFGPNLWGCPWILGYFLGALISVIIFVFLFLKRKKVRCFLIAVLVYLFTGSIFILVDFEPGYKLFSELMACAFFGVYFLVHLFQAMFPKVCNGFIEATPKYPFVTLSLYLGVVIGAYFLREQAVWIQVLPFLVARFFVAYIDS